VKSIPILDQAAIFNRCGYELTQENSSTRDAGWALEVEARPIWPMLDHPADDIWQFDSVCLAKNDNRNAIDQQC
jgi:hypothetical protein